MSRLDYWRQQAQEAEAEFYRLNAEQDQEDMAITALVDLIHASHQVERLSDPELPYADCPTTYTLNWLLTEPCPYCLAEIGEPCRPDCLPNE